jgi:hypothetical protein
MTQLTPAKYAKFVAAVTRRLVAARSPRHFALSLSDHVVPGFSRRIAQLAFGIPCALIRLEPRLDRKGVSE